MTLSSPHTKPIPFSRVLEGASVGDAGLRQAIEASETERRALASLAGLVAIESLSAALKIRREGRHGLRVTGDVTARIRQTCVVTLDEFDADVVEPVDVRFLPPAEIEAEAARRAKVQPEIGVEDEQDDLPDPIFNGKIDLGAVAAEHLVLGLDPYPKKPGTVFVGPKPFSDEEGTVSPFAILGRLKSS